MDIAELKKEVERLYTENCELRKAHKYKETIYRFLDGKIIAYAQVLTLLERGT